MLKQAVQQGRRRIETGGVPSGAHGATNKEHQVCARRRVVRRPVPGEDLNDARTKLAGCFSILLQGPKNEHHHHAQQIGQHTGIEECRPRTTRRVVMRQLFFVDKFTGENQYGQR